jgi:hypothetical protein
MNKQNDAPERNDIVLFLAGIAFAFLVINVPTMYRTFKNLSEIDFDGYAENSTTVLERTTFATPQDRSFTIMAFATVPYFFGASLMLCMAFAISLVATGWIAFREYTLPGEGSVLDHFWPRGDR